MYSIVLMAAMTSSPAQPQGIFFNRGGCNGTRATPVRTFVREVVTNRPTPIRTLWQNRPHLFRSSGCSGSTFAATTASACATFVERTVTRTRTVIRGGVGCTTCPGGACPVPVGYQVMPTPEGGPIREFVKKHEIDRALRRIISHKGLTPEQKAQIQKIDLSRRSLLAKALAEPEAWQKSVAKVTVETNAQIAKGINAGQQLYGFQFSGKLIQMLIDNLPQILAFVEAILKDLHVISIPLDNGGYLILGFHKVSGAVVYLGIV